jgi:pancreatic triacylglycerol lipase
LNRTLFFVMSYLRLTLFVAAIFAGAFAEPEETRREVCYETYGCFNTDAPWTSALRPLSALPNPPYEVQTRFVLYTRGSDEGGYDLMVGKDVLLELSPFDPSRKSVFIIHGFTDDSRIEHIQQAKNSLLANGDYNVFLVDWAPGAKSPYLKASANARLVGAVCARFLFYLQEKGGLRFEDVHLIGHNLGAHVAGYVGDRTLGQIPRITAFDPSEPYFANTDPIVRLDPNDAKFVEVVHTNGAGAISLGMGILDPIGHVDIYPNGGKKQPGCNDLLGSLIGSIIDLITLDFQGAISIWACSHVRGGHFYAESVRNAASCPFIAYQCADYSTFEKGNCYSSCKEPGKCIPLGYNSVNFTGSGQYYMHTGTGENGTPYCRQSVQVQVPISTSQAHAVGTFSVQFKAADGTKSEKFILVDNSDMNAGQMMSKWVEVPSHIMHTPNEQVSLILHYQRGGLLPINQPKTLAIDGVNLLVVDTAFQSQTISYGGIILDYGTDTQISN